MTKTSLLILVCLITLPTTVFGQYNLNTENLKRQAQELSDSMLNGNYERAADLTFPKLVQLIGGRTQYIAMLKKSAPEMHSEQLRITSITVGEPRDFVNEGRTHYAIVPMTMKFKVKEGTLIGEAYMIGSSSDGGKNWTFVDSGGRSLQRAQLRTLFGPAADKLKLPEMKQPVLIPGN